MKRPDYTRLLTVAGAVMLLPGFAVPGLAGTVFAAPAPHGRISTLIGGRGGPALATNVSIAPCALKYVAGELYFSSYQAVVDRVSQRTGVLTPIAGNGVDLPGEPGPADGIYRKRMTAGRVYTVASGFEGVADSKGAISGGAVDVQLDSSGSLVIAVAGTVASSHPEGDSRVFVYAQHAGTFYGVKMAEGGLYCIGGSLDDTTRGQRRRP